MKRNEIHVGHTYQNKGAGNTRRKVVAIGTHIVPERYFGGGERPAEVGVKFVQTGLRGMYTDELYLSSFAQWAGKDVTEDLA